jgi:hypothetical protein
MGAWCAGVGFGSRRGVGVALWRFVPGGGGHVGAQDRVHAGLVAGALGAEPGDDVGIETQGEELLGGGGDENGILVPVGGDVFPIGVGGDGGFEFGFGHGVDAVPIGEAFAVGAAGLNFLNGIALDIAFARHGGLSWPR